MSEHILELTYRPFACDKCGTMHMQQTNHSGQIYNVKCNNWPCTPGEGEYTTMSFWDGPTEKYETTFVRSTCSSDLVWLDRKVTNENLSKQ